MDVEKRPVKAKVDAVSEDEKTGEDGGATREGIDRIVLRRAEAYKLDSWIKDLNRKFDGMIRVTKSDLANFLIRQHGDRLTDAETALVETEFYDEVRWLNWALAKIREAKKQGQLLSLDGLMAKRHSAAQTTAASAKRAGESRTKGTTKKGNGNGTSEAIIVSDKDPSAPSLNQESDPKSSNP